MLGWNPVNGVGGGTPTRFGGFEPSPLDREQGSNLLCVLYPQVRPSTTGSWRITAMGPRPWDSNNRVMHPEGSRNSSTRLDQPQQARRGLLVVALSFLYRLVRRVFEAARVQRLDAAAKDAEILVLRHQLAVLRRQVDCPRFTWSDRAFVALFACLVPRECWRSFLVTPQTILGWHRSLVKKRWTYPHRGPGHPSLPEETVNLICRLARENPRW